MNNRIYIIEDDISISTLLKNYIDRYGFEGVIATNFNDIMEEFDKCMPSLILLDINLPKFDGFYWCTKIRQKSNITKPFQYEVVIAKIKSHLRRCYGEYAPKLNERIVELDGLKFYPERLELKFNDKNIIITKKEGILLECLIKKYPKVVSRDYLLEKIWDDIEFVEENTLNVNVSRIRKRLNDLGIEDAVSTVRGIGYKLNKNW